MQAVLQGTDGIGAETDSLTKLNVMIPWWMRPSGISLRESTFVQMPTLLCGAYDRQDLASRLRLWDRPASQR